MKIARIGFAALALVLTSGVANAQQAAQRAPARMPHAAAGKEQCLTCHAQNANPHIKSQPASHNFPVTACAMCHRVVDTLPPAVPHAMGDAFAQCKTCHVANSPMGAPAAPATHANWNIAICGMCHQARPRGT